MSALDDEDQEPGPATETSWGGLSASALDAPQRQHETPVSIEKARAALGLSEEAAEEILAAVADEAHEGNPDWKRAPSDDSPDRTGEVHQVEDIDPRSPESRRIPGGPLGDMIENAGGYLVVSMGSGKTVGMQPLRDCIVCGEPVRNPADSWVCEFTGDVTARPRFTGWKRGKTGSTLEVQTSCRCNACVWNEDRRTRGRPKEVCSADCERERERLDKAVKRARANERERDRAADLLREYPDLTDAEVMEQTGITVRKRVTEARSMLAESVPV